MDDTTVYTSRQVADLLNMVVSGIHVGSQIEDRVYTLEEVAARTGWALSSLEDDCRRDRIQHVKRGRSLGMTARQIAAEAARHARGGDTSTVPAQPAKVSALRSGATRRARKAA